MLPSETMIWQPEFTDKTLSRKPGAVHKCFQEQVICHGKANQKYRLILVFKPFLLVSMIQRLSKKLGNSTTLGNYGLCPAALI
ncbi:hypothetical protein [Escherichia coli]|uniref:hypothetical protein n=1 Tax=Escherichia coli TaxID=562 RepID=UPI000F0AA5F9|nr:hypothetical protein [Escherichia coli]